ncbi:MAG TPA: helix-turn-helix transcriptional regulator [Chloroflexota bacterium]
MGSESRERVLLAIARVIRERRLALGLSQDQFGHRAGLYRTYVGGVERGERNLTITSLCKIASALQLEAHDLLEQAGL